MDDDGVLLGEVAEQAVAVLHGVVFVAEIGKYRDTQLPGYTP